MEEELKKSPLIPKDPADDKNIIVKLRAELVETKLQFCGRYVQSLFNGFKSTKGLKHEITDSKKRLRLQRTDFESRR